MTNTENATMKTITPLNVGKGEYKPRKLTHLLRAMQKGTFIDLDTNDRSKNVIYSTMSKMKKNEGKNFKTTLETIKKGKKTTEVLRVYYVGDSPKKKVK